MRNAVFAFFVICSTSLFFSANGPANISSGEISGAAAGMQSLSLAEAGLDAAVQFLESQDAEGWELDHADARLTVSGLELGGGVSGGFDVLIENWDGLSPVVTSEGRVTAGSGPPSIQKLRLAPRFRLGGITAQCRMTFSGGVNYVESYKSSMGHVGRKEYEKRDQAVVAARTISSSSIDLGNGQIWGYAVTGGGPVEVGPHGSVQGEDSPPLPLIDPARVGRDFNATFPLPIPPPAWSDPPAVDIPALEAWIAANGVSRSVEDYIDAANRGSGSHRTNYGNINTTTILGIPGATNALVVYADSINAWTGVSLRIVGPVILVVRGDIVVGGGGWLQVGFEAENKEGAALHLYSYGNLRSTGHRGMENRTRIPSNLVIFGMAPDVPMCNSSQTFYLGGNASWEAVVYAPHADITLNAGGHNGFMAGAVVGMSVDMNGGSSFHYDEDTEALWSRPSFVRPDSQTPPGLSDLGFRLHVTNTGTYPGWNLRPRWSVSPQIQTEDPNWTSLVVVSSPGEEIQAFLNHPEGVGSFSTTFNNLDDMVAGISGTWTIDIDPEGEQPRRYYFTVDATWLPEIQLGHVEIYLPSVELLADEFEASWEVDFGEHWDGLEYSVYHLIPYEVEFSGDRLVTESSLLLPSLPKTGPKRLTIIYKNEGGGIPGLEVGTPYDGSGSAPFAWQVAPHTSFSRRSVDFAVISRFQRWLAGHLSQQERNDPATGGLLASPRGDGLTNLEKYALGMPLLSYDPSRLPAFAISRGEDAGAGNYLTLTFRIVADDPALSYAVGVSSDLESWHYSDTPESEVETDVTDNGDGTLTVTARAPKRAGEKREFMRLLLRYE